MANRDPLVIIGGKVQQLPAGDAITPNPGSITLSYTGDQLTSVVGPTGTKTLVYSGTQLQTISDTGSNTLSTFNYTGSRLDSITVTPL
jgi:hypothetical protein